MKSKIDTCIDSIAPSPNFEIKSILNKFLLCMILPCTVTAILMFCIKFKLIIAMFNSMLALCNTDLFFMLSMPFSIYIILAMINWGVLASENDFLFAPNRFLFKKLLASILSICSFLFFAIITLGVVAQPGFVFNNMSILKIISFGFLISAIVVSFVVAFPRYLQWNAE